MHVLTRTLTQAQTIHYVAIADKDRGEVRTADVQYKSERRQLIKSTKLLTSIQCKNVKSRLKTIKV